jgi:serine/threonine-protein kinase
MTAQTIGRYQLDRTVGEGAYGTVYRAVDPTLDRAVAVKLLKPDVRDANGPETSLEEARTLAKMNHPNIDTLYEVLDHAGQTALVMEYLEGEVLSDYLARVQPGLEVRLLIGRQIADALREAHGHGIVHADIKPGNIIVRADGKPVVVDFGLSKAVPQSTEMATLTGGSVGQNMILGTLAYMAPEVMKGSKPDERSDIFSFGALFYELLTGARAFRAPSDAETVNLVLNVDPMPVSAHDAALPAWCANLAARMLAKDREGRPKSFADILKAIDTADAGTPVKDRHAAQGRPRLVTGKRIAIALLLMIATVTGFIGAQYYGGEPLTVSSRISAGLDKLRNSQEKGAIEEAKQSFQSVLREDPENAAATAGYSLALLQEYANLETDPSILRNASAAAELAIALDNQLALAHVAQAWAQEFSGDAKAAIDSYNVALAMDPDGFMALFGYGRLLLDQGRYSEAVGLFEKASSLYPGESRFSVYLADLYYRQGEFSVAEKAARRAIELAPDHIYAYRTLGSILYAQSKTIDAISVTQKGLAIRPDAMLYNNLGTFYYALGQYAQAVSAFERAVDHQGNSHHYFYWANLGDAYSMLADGKEKSKVAYQRAIQLLLERMNSTETRPNLLSRAGLYYAKAGDNGNAQIMTAKAMEKAPDDRWVLFRAAVVQDLGQNRDEALNLLARAIEAGQPITDIKNEPYLAGLREDPRYHKLMAQKNIN